MFIAHLPSGYILAKALQSKINNNYLKNNTYFFIVMLGAIFPDIDLFYFYFLDNRSVHHHQYFLHWFSFWIPLFLISYFCLWRSAFRSKVSFLANVFCAGALLHISLDTFVGDVWLFAPFVMKPYVFFEVTARYQPWWLNFILHWSFLVELIICSIALMIFLKGRKNKSLQ